MFEELAYFARVGGLIYLMLLFAGVLVYTFWPRNRDTFERAAQMPLQNDDLPRAAADD